MHGYLTPPRRLALLGALALSACSPRGTPMAEDLETQIARVPPGALPAEGAGLVVAVRDEARSLSDHYEAALEASAVPAGPPLAGLIRTPPLASPDALTVVSARRTGSRFHVVLEIREYTGALFGNVETVGLVLAVLGPLQAGPYDLVAELRTRSFDDLDHPEAAGEPSVSTRHLSFRVR